MDGISLGKNFSRRSFYPWTGPARREGQGGAAMKRIHSRTVILGFLWLFVLSFVPFIQEIEAYVLPRTVSVSATASGTPGQTGVAVPISVTDASGIAGADITLTFDSSILTATNAQLTTLTSGFTLQTPTISPGQITISMTQATGIPSGSGAILNVIFNVNPSAVGGTYSVLTLQSVSLLNQSAQPILCAKLPGLFMVIPAENPDLTNFPPTPPINVSPLDGSSFMGLTPTLSASPFVDLNTGDTHAASRWQVSQDPLIGTPAFDSGETATDKTSIILPAGVLAPSITYYWRVQYKDSQGAWSEWSSLTSFIPQAPAETWAGEVSFSLKFSKYVEDSSGNEKFGSETVPFTGTLEIYWINEVRNLATNENGCYVYCEGTSPYGTASFCITQKASMITDYVNPATADTSYLKGAGTFRGDFDGELLEGLIFIDVTKATFKKTKAGEMVSISFSSKIGGGSDDVTVFSGSLNGTLTRK